MKIGDYIRINNGQIAKIVKIKEYKKWLNIIYTDIAIDMHEDRACNDNFVDEEDIIKSSPNIIDLIEVGDYVNGGKVYEKEKDYIVINADFGNLFEFMNIYEKDIKSIVTKEQFEIMKYRVGE